jgi:MFS family permease
VINILSGFPISFGVFQDYYTSLPEFKDSSNVALIGTISQGSVYLGAPLSAALSKRFPQWQRRQILLGWPLCIVGLIAGSYANTLGGLIATQGVMYGIGFVTLTYPIISMVNEWWLLRKGMAFGLISAASGASGTFLPFIISALLQRYGHKVTLRVIAIGMTILTLPLLPFLKGRLPPAARSTMARTNWVFLKRPLFYIFCVSTLVQGLGFFFPSLYLPSYATASSLSSTVGALLLAIMAIAQIVGQFAFGWLSDKNVSVIVLCSICSVMACFACFGLWGLAHSQGLLIGFSIVYGVFGYAFGTLRVGMGRAVSEDENSLLATYSMLVFLQGVGNILAGPIGGALIRDVVDKKAYGIARYRDVVIFTGVSMFVSAAVLCLWYLRPRRA